MCPHGHMHTCIFLCVRVCVSDPVCVLVGVGVSASLGLCEPMFVCFRSCLYKGSVCLQALAHICAHMPVYENLCVSLRVSLSVSL